MGTGGRVAEECAHRGRRLRAEEVLHAAGLGLGELHRQLENLVEEHLGKAVPADDLARQVAAGGGQDGVTVLVGDETLLGELGEHGGPRRGRRGGGNGPDDLRGRRTAGLRGRPELLEDLVASDCGVTWQRFTHGGLQGELQPSGPRSRRRRNGSGSSDSTRCDSRESEGTPPGSSRGRESERRTAGR